MEIIKIYLLLFIIHIETAAAWMSPFHSLSHESILLMLLSWYKGHLLMNSNKNALKWKAALFKAIKITITIIIIKIPKEQLMKK